MAVVAKSKSVKQVVATKCACGHLSSQHVDHGIAWALDHVTKKDLEDGYAPCTVKGCKCANFAADKQVLDDGSERKISTSSTLPA
jgi:hypothetical protein